MLRSASALYPPDRPVVRRIRHHHRCGLGSHDALHIDRRRLGVAARERGQAPIDRRSASQVSSEAEGEVVGGIELDEIAEQAVDLGGLEASNLHIEAALRQHHVAQLSGKQLAVPPGVERNFVVGKRQRALLGLRFRSASVITGTFGNPSSRRHRIATVSRKDLPVLVGKDDVPAKPPDAVDDLLDLFLRMGPGIPPVGAEITDGQEGDVTIFHGAQTSVE